MCFWPFGRNPRIGRRVRVARRKLGTRSPALRRIDVSSQNIKGEAHFNWVLEGRAIQDV
jgi:hypothetical protein